MSWIVIGEEKGKIKLISKSVVTGLLPKGSYLTIEGDNSKFILRVDGSSQSESYSPSPLIVDMDLSPLKQDQKCQNIILAHRVKDLTKRTDGFIDYIKPQSLARRSTQEEIDLAMGGSENEGPPVFMGTVYSGENQILRDEVGKLIKANLPEDMFYHQMFICGKTGSGKTVATKYLSQYFVEQMGGAALVINVKERDFLSLDKPSKTSKKGNKEEWESLKQEPHGVTNYTIYYPSTSRIDDSEEVSKEACKKITLNVSEIEPEALTGIIQNISDLGAQYLPDIFRYWKEKASGAYEDKSNFKDFVEYFKDGEDNKREFNTLNSRGDESALTLHKGTFDSVLRNLNNVMVYFDDNNAASISEKDILQKGKISVINVVPSPLFGSILLRDLLRRIVRSKANKESNVPVLIVIDEVHTFYDSNASREALGDLDTICRIGRSNKIGVIFSSQNPSDMPSGLSSVINTKIFFKTDQSSLKNHGITATHEELEGLKKGFAFASIYDLPQLKILKFPLSLSGVFEK